MNIIILSQFLNIVPNFISIYQFIFDFYCLIIHSEELLYRCFFYNHILYSLTDTCTLYQII